LWRDAGEQRTGRRREQCAGTKPTLPVEREIDRTATLPSA